MNQLLLKQLFQMFIFCFLSISSYAQNFNLKIEGTNNTENKTIDSLKYSAQHTNLKSLFDEIKNTSAKLSKKGFLDNKILETKTINDSTYTSIIELKNKIKEVHIYIGINNSFSNISKTQNDSIILTYEEVENYMNQQIRDAEKAGYALTKINLKNIRRKNLIIYADLNFKSEKKRKLNSIIL